MIRPATCEGSEARRSRWTRTDFDQHSVNEEHSEQHSVIRDDEGTSSKFEAALKDFEALEQGQGARCHNLNVKCSIAANLSHTHNGQPCFRWEGVPQPRVWPDDSKIGTDPR